MSIDVNHRAAYYGDREVPADPPTGTEYHKGECPGPNLTDTALESRDYRSQFPEDIGEICISVEPGDEIGELYFSVQFEARPGEHDPCQTNQNQVLIEGCDWLREVLEGISMPHVKWDASVEAHPCPDAKVRVGLELASRVLDGSLDVREALRQQLQSDHQQAIGIEVGQQVELKGTHHVENRIQ